MIGIRKVLLLLTKLKTISAPCGRRCISSTPYNSTTVLSDTSSIAGTAVCSDDLMENSKMPFLLEVTSKIGIQLDNLISCLKISPQLIKESPEAWENSFKEVTAYGFSKKNFMRMITMYPPLFKMVNNAEFGPAMEKWMNCNLGYDNMLDLLSTQPQFLSVPLNELGERIPFLKSVTKSGGRSVAKLLQNCPSLMYQDWRDVTTKVDYIENVMKVDLQKENLSKCYALNRTLSEIQTRHMFLERAGIYIRPQKVKGTKIQQEQQPWSKNPRLAEITDTNEAVFISKIAKGLSLEELEVFREMYQQEIGEESGSESEDD